MIKTCLVAAAFAVLPAIAIAGEPFDQARFSAKAGTLGTGVEGDWRLDPFWGVRAGLFAGRINFDWHDKRADLKNQATFLNGQLTADYYPWQDGFRLSGGVVVSASQIKGRVYNINRTVKAFGRKVTVTVPDPLTRYTVTANPVQPFIGAGYSHPISERISLDLDVGALYAGEPNLDVVSHAGRLGFTKRQIDAEIAKARARASDYQFMPVIGLGIKIKF